MSKIKWIEPNDNNDINYNDDFIVIFKHSYRCIISRIVLKKFEFDYKDFSNIKFYLIDVVKNKKLSNELSSYFNVNHESPQLMVVNKGKLVHNSSHSNISFKNINK
ncbi:bacillithiol system redox-active protein YtxJ [Flavobacteriaceae bacterium]|jgi:bacillithiol system protein YtxJ|nr:bacillithiol system redox-active protein YtxJ [Flavobacteriaceae bacterium]